MRRRGGGGTGGRGRLRVGGKALRRLWVLVEWRGGSRGYSRQTESGWEPQGAGKPQHPQPAN